MVNNHTKGTPPYYDWLQSYEADMNVFRTDGQSDHYRTFATMWRSPDNLLHVFLTLMYPSRPVNAYHHHCYYLKKKLKKIHCLVELLSL